MKRIIEFVKRPYMGWTLARVPRKTPEPALLPRVGLLWNSGAVWLGYHYSDHHKRLCVNLLPFLTIWYTRPGGVHP